MSKFFQTAQTRFVAGILTLVMIGCSSNGPTTEDAASTDALSAPPPAVVQSESLDGSDNSFTGLAPEPEPIAKATHRHVKKAKKAKKAKSLARANGKQKKKRAPKLAE